MQVKEPFDHGRACVVLLLGTLVVAGIEAGKALGRLVARVKEAGK